MPYYIIDSMNLLHPKDDAVVPCLVTIKNYVSRIDPC